MVVDGISEKRTSSATQIWWETVTTTRTCSYTGHHRPRPHQIDSHHITPQSWGTGHLERIDLCAGCHHNVHSLIDEYIRHAGEPPIAILRRYTGLERDLAAQAWANRPNDKPPITELHWGG